MPGRAVRHRGPLAQSRVTRESSKTPRAIGYGPSRPRELVDTSGHLTRAQVSRECWWTPRALGPGSESHGTPGRRRGHSDPGPSRAGQLVDTVCPLTRAGIAQRSWSTPRALGPEPSRPRDVVDPRTLGHGTNSPVPMVDTGVPRKLARVARGLLVDSSGRWTRAGVAQDSWSTPSALGPEPHSPGTAG